MALMLEIKESRGDRGAVRLSLLGELDLDSGAGLAVRLADTGRAGPDVVVDLRGLTDLVGWSGASGRW
jgi:hypothetical protein